jgi:AcrR family transcriptional regulator
MQSCQILEMHGCKHLFPHTLRFCEDFTVDTRDRRVYKNTDQSVFFPIQVKGQVAVQQRSEETRARILGAALKEFSGSGYDAASVDDICAEAGVSKGAFYHHFPSKQAAFLAIFEDWLGSVDKGLNLAQQATVPETLTNMSRMLPVIFTQADGQLPMFLEFWLQASRDDTIWKATVAPYQRYLDYFTTLVKQGIAEGTFRKVDPQSAAQVIVSFAVGLLLQGLIAPSDTDWQKTAEQSMKILMKGLAK